MTPEEFADGFALWEEHRPQSAEDWQAVARRCVDSDYDPSDASPLFGALYWTMNELVTLEAQNTEDIPK